jgi:putative hemolysin
MAPAVDRFATLVRPVIWLLSVSTDAVVRLVGGDPEAAREEMSEEELRQLLMSHHAIPRDERAVLQEVLAAAGRTVREVMRPRHDVVFLPGSLSVDEALERVGDLPWSRYPVTGDDFDDILGFVHVRDLYEDRLRDRGGRRRVRSLVRRIVLLPQTNALLPSLTILRRERTHIAVIVDEYGGTDGIVTLEDLVEELVGEIHDEWDVPAEVLRVGLHGDTVVDAGLNLEDFREAVGITLPDTGVYDTVGGYVLDRLGRLAEVGDVVPAGDHELEVVDVDGNHIERVRVRPPA